MKRLGFGLMRLPVNTENGTEVIDMELTKQMIDTFLEKGFTYFDTAYMYMDHKSEITVKEALVSRHPRSNFTLTTKLPVYLLNNREDMERIFNEQLNKCGVDYFDYYLIHNLNMQHCAIADKVDCYGFLQEMKKEGKIKTIGFSFHDSAELLDKILREHPEMEVVQLQLNYLDWESEGIEARKCYEAARKYGKDIIVMEPVKGGALANLPEEAETLLTDYAPENSTASWAVRYAAGYEGVMMVLSGMSNMEQLLDNINHMQDFVPLNQKEHDILEKAADIINGLNDIPCTSCSYCVEGCPMNIPIPKYFALYNVEQRAKKGDFSLQKAYYENAIEVTAKASDCIACGQCEGSCPQHIGIIEEMKKVVSAFE